jgi:hypothetical protein
MVRLLAGIISKSISVSACSRISTATRNISPKIPLTPIKRYYRLFAVKPSSYVYLPLTTAKITVENQLYEVNLL